MAKSWDDLTQELREGSVVALSRLISRVEAREAGWMEAMQKIYPLTGNASVTGITGPPGAGKSTLTCKIAQELARRQDKVGIIAIDPSSPFSGGALLGDRVRMSELSGMDNVFVRSMATRGTLGGLTQSTRDVAKIMDAFGFDHILIETVGVGQDEIEVVRAADLVIVVCIPGQGDIIQVSKAGVMEIADLFVVNKADLDGANQVAKDIRSMLHLRLKPGAASPPVMKAIATTGDGVPEIVEQGLKLLHAMRQKDAWLEDRIKDELIGLLNRELIAVIKHSWNRNGTLDSQVKQILRGQDNPYSVVQNTLAPIEKLFTRQ